MKDDLFYTNVLKKIKNHRGYPVDSMLRGVEFNFETEVNIMKTAKEKMDEIEINAKKFSLTILVSNEKK
ncbi:6531_t:CDS:1, partial [Cetraspora pellucida]